MQLQQQVGCNSHAAQPDRRTAPWLVQTGTWWEWAVLAVKAGSGPPARHKAIDVCHGERQPVNSSGVLQEPGCSEEIQTQYISQGTLWAQRVVAEGGHSWSSQEDGWRQESLPPSMLCTDPLGKGGCLAAASCHRSCREWRGAQTPLPCKFTAGTGGWMGTLTGIFLVRQKQMFISGSFCSTGTLWPCKGWIWTSAVPLLYLGGKAVGWLQHKLSVLYGSSPGNPLTF